MRITICMLFHFHVLYIIVSLSNLIRESVKIEPQSAILLSTLLRSDTSDNAIKAMQMRSKWQMQFIICLLRKIRAVWCMQKEETITL